MQRVYASAGKGYATWQTMGKDREEMNARRACGTSQSRMENVVQRDGS